MCVPVYNCTCTDAKKKTFLLQSPPPPPDPHGQISQSQNASMFIYDCPIFRKWRRFNSIKGEKKEKKEKEMTLTFISWEVLKQSKHNKDEQEMLAKMPKWKHETYGRTKMKLDGRAERYVHYINDESNGFLLKCMNSRAKAIQVFHSLGSFSLNKNCLIKSFIKVRRRLLTE